jgi:purine-nucleoside phosphorylase
MDGTTMDMYEESAKFLKTNTPESLQNPRVAIICGSGLGGLAGTVQEEGKVELDYGSIPHFSRSAGKTVTLRSGPLQYLMHYISI